MTERIPTGPTGPNEAESDRNFTVRVMGPTGSAGAIEPAEVSNKDIEEGLKGLLVAFERSGTEHYQVQRAKTSIITTKNAEGKLGISFGLGIFKVLDAGGKVVGEKKEGIEIEIERIETR